MLNGKDLLKCSRRFRLITFPIIRNFSFCNFNQSCWPIFKKGDQQLFNQICWQLLHFHHRFFCIAVDLNFCIDKMNGGKKVKSSVKPVGYSSGSINKKANQKNLSTTKVKNGNRMNMVLQKKHGQHLLKNPGILEKIIIASKIKRTDTVLEVGCGTGNLTVKLLPIAKKVITIDIDSRMINEVKKRCLYEGYTNLEVYEGDAIKTVFPPFDVFTANIPYKISSPLIFKLITHRPKFRCAVLMFQKEFADRMLANPGDRNYSRLSINVKMFFKVVKVCNVDRGSFNPPPKVDSIVLKLIPKNVDTRINFEELDNLLRICFSRKRKTLHAIFKRDAVLNMLEHNYKNFCTLNNKAPTDENFKTFCLQVLTDLEFNELRSVNLDMTDFLTLLIEFNKRDIHFCNISDTKNSAFGVQWGDEDDEEDETKK